MKWKQMFNELDYEDREETEKILEIAEHFLCKYFGHDLSYADEILYQFLHRYSQRYDEDFIHHEMSYRVAATVHFIIHLNGSTNDLGNWLVETGHARPDPEATEYFRKHFFA